ncbi:MAG: ROK family protein [Ideonella sp.]|nr:ROK family protein [Ideonella sp.]
MSKTVSTAKNPGLGSPGSALVGGIEAGGTHIKCVVGTVEGDIQDSTAFNTAGPDETIERALGFFSGLRGGIQALGIAHFGPVDIARDSPRFGHVLTTPKRGWADRDVVSEYRRGLAVPIAFQSDVNASAIGEGALGAAQGLRHYVYVTVGTGIGAGVVVNGQLLHDDRHTEVGHMLVGRDFKRDTYPGCCPFHGDCLEGLASGTALQGRWGVPGEQLAPDHPGWSLQAHYLAVMCVNLSNCYVPQRIILGGGAMQQPMLIPMIRQRFAELMGGYMGGTLDRLDGYIVASPMQGQSATRGALILAGQLLGQAATPAPASSQSVATALSRTMPTSSVASPRANQHGTHHATPQTTPCAPEVVDCLTPAFLDAQARAILSSYYPACVRTTSGGFHQYFHPDGRPDQGNQQSHLVSCARLTINFAGAARHFGDPGYLAAAQEGLSFLRTAHHDPATGAYAWIVDQSRPAGKRVVDAQVHAYGLAFVLMACARAHQVGVAGACEHLEAVYAFMERHLWEDQHGLYADELGPDLTQKSPYRGQNANMHCCEALIAAFEATGEPKYLKRALRIAHRLTVVLASPTQGLLWEHYSADWQHDFDYNRHDLSNKLRPWGYQPGHMTEWAKLLLSIHRHEPHDWLLSRAHELFNHAMRLGYDREHGGLYYTVAPDGAVCNDAKYSWVQAETIAAAAYLADALQQGLYWSVYRELWAYVLQHMVDRQLKCWHRNLTRSNQVFVDAVAMGRTDYHAIGVCIDVSRLLRQAAA